MRKSTGYNRTISNTKREVRKMNKTLKGWPFVPLGNKVEPFKIGGGAGPGTPD